jgi:hypothetical protein
MRERVKPSTPSRGRCVSSRKLLQALATEVPRSVPRTWDYCLASMLCSCSLPLGRFVDVGEGCLAYLDRAGYKRWNFLDVVAM